MMIKAVFFDLDGTLLPMDQEQFAAAYFKELAKVVCPLGIAADALISAVLAGTRAMVKNDGAQRNETVFWQTFVNLTGMELTRVRQVTDDFYCRAFHNVRSLTGANPLAKKAVTLARGQRRKVVLATNPIFPLAGQLTRLSWIGLSG